MTTWPVRRGNVSGCPSYRPVTTWAIPIFILLVVLEWVSFRLQPADNHLGYSVKGTATSLSMGIGSIFCDLPWKLPILAGYLAPYEVTPLRYEFTW